tara:strand:+ start:511 stop:753 length:243 start_codon:yes stop_codon:yes gene_type:complete
MGKASLTDFALANPPASTGYEAWITTIPEWEEILTAWQSGTVAAAQIRRWLIEERGYSHELATRNKVAHLSKHFPRTRRG